MTVFRAFSPSSDRSGTTYADKARATSQAAVRNQFVITSPDATQVADWTVQKGTVTWHE